MTAITDQAGRQEGHGTAEVAKIDAEEKAIGTIMAGNLRLINSDSKGPQTTDDGAPFHESPHILNIDRPQQVAQHQVDGDYCGHMQARTEVAGGKVINDKDWNPREQHQAHESNHHPIEARERQA